MAGAQHWSVQRLPFFLSESRWDSGRINSWRLELLLADSATTPHNEGVLVIDDSADRKDGARTAYVGHQRRPPQHDAAPQPGPGRGLRGLEPHSPGRHARVRAWLPSGLRPQRC